MGGSNKALRDTTGLAKKETVDDLKDYVKRQFKKTEDDLREARAELFKIDDKLSTFSKYDDLHNLESFHLSSNFKRRTGRMEDRKHEEVRR